ncbi:ogr/Delta-like zinc finger family protein [Photobacterium damselae]|uniref:ogr/Delta-like zinc finger family protein n=1 Tax=Photobacterium damselae TaxID=38293 RepID=UPI00387EBA43
MCPICHGTKTIIRTSKRLSNEYQVLYCDCLNIKCLTRFTINSTLGKVLHSLKDEMQQVEDKCKEEQLPLNL